MANKKSLNKTLNKANKKKNDEFYTRQEDIEAEMRWYKDTGVFNNKVVFCNCDDPTKSYFWKYFVLYFKRLKLKKLVSTHYQPSRLFEENTPAYKLEYDGKKEKKTMLKGDGSFESDECVEILKRSDIVVTNPPFSKFSSFVNLLIEHKKNFLIVGNINAVIYKDIFPLIRSNKIWLGCTPEDGNFYFQVPDDYDGNIEYVKNGKNFVKMRFAVWFTNLPHKKRNAFMDCLREYNKKDYPTYDNYDAIEVDFLKKIPKDYYGDMGVPKTFVNVYNPDQFEIVGRDGDMSYDGKCLSIKGTNVFARIIVRRKKKRRKK